MLQEDEDVLVISLGYSAIECPGMEAEEKVQYLNLFDMCTDGGQSFAWRTLQLVPKAIKGE